MNCHEIRISGRQLALSDDTRLNAVVSERLLALVQHDAGKLLALVSEPGAALEHLAAGVVALSCESGQRMIAARARIDEEDALVFMLPEEFYGGDPMPQPIAVVVRLERNEFPPLVVGW